MPPFVVGEDTNLRTSKNVWIYDGETTGQGRRQITVDSSCSSYRVVIGGDRIDYKTTSNSNTYHNSVIILGGESRIQNPGSPSIAYSGVTIQGSYSYFFANSKRDSSETNPNLNDILFQGVHLLGHFSDIYTQDSWKDSWSENNGVNANGGPGFKATSHIPYNLGIIQEGAYSTFSGTSEGVVIMGTCGVFECVNRGVFICANPEENPELQRTGYSLPQRYTGIGIGIFGATRTRQKLEDGYGSSIFGNSHIVLSSMDKHPTILHGNMRLGDDFTLKDKDGRIVIFENGKLVTK